MASFETNFDEIWCNERWDGEGGGMERVASRLIRSIKTAIEYNDQSCKTARLSLGSAVGYSFLCEETLSLAGIFNLRYVLRG